MLAVSPAYSSDFQSSDNALRIRGRAFATWQWVPEELTLLFGVVYLDRNDLPLLPGVCAHFANADQATKSWISSDCTTWQ